MHGWTYRHNPPQDLRRAIVPNWGAPPSDTVQREVVGEMGEADFEAAAWHADGFE
jgi:hypothetical protein